jgi:hypothetical protein
MAKVAGVASEGEEFILTVYGTGCVWANSNWICPSYGGMPYIVNASAPVESAKAPDPSPNLAGATLFP